VPSSSNQTTRSFISIAACKDADGALADYNRAIELEPKQAFAYGNLAFVYMSKGEYDRALAEYTHALELDPRFANAYNGRAQLYNKKGMLTEGLADAEQALSLDPKSPLAHASAHILEALGRRNEAIGEYKKALALEPDLLSSIEGLKSLAKTKP